MDPMDVESRERRRVDVSSWIEQWLDSTKSYQFPVPEYLRINFRTVGSRYLVGKKTISSPCSSYDLTFSARPYTTVPLHLTQNYMSGRIGEVVFILM